MSRLSAGALAAGAAAVLPAALAVQGACGTGGDGGARAAASVASSATASSSGTGLRDAAGPGSSSGSGGSGTGGAGVGGAGADPVWTTLDPSTTPWGCFVERVSNAAQVRAFSWAPCAGVAGCEQTVAAPWIAGLQLENGVVEEEPGQVRMIFAIGSGPGYTLLFTTGEGWLLEAFRTVGKAAKPSCAVYAGAARGSRYGVLMVAGPVGPYLQGGFLNDFGAATPATPFEISQPLGFGPSVGEVPMSADRWAWHIAGGRIVTVSTADAGDFVNVAPTADASALAIDSIATDGKTFLFADTFGTPDGGVTSIIATSDGTTGPVPYIVPTDGSIYDYPTYAGGYVAWFKGIGFITLNDYQKMELWASVYSPDPASIAPFKVDDYPYNSVLSLMGSNGRIAAGLTDTTTGVWDLKTKVRTVLTVPSGLGIDAYLGMTSQYLWVEAGPGGVQTNVISNYLRFALQ